MRGVELRGPEIDWLASIALRRRAGALSLLGDLQRAAHTDEKNRYVLQPVEIGVDVGWTDHGLADDVVARKSNRTERAGWPVTSKVGCPGSGCERTAFPALAQERAIAM